MIIHYSTNKLEKILSNERLIKRHHSTHYTNLTNRLSELSAAVSLEMISHIPPPRRHKLNGDLQGCWGIDISKNFRLVVEPYGTFDIEDPNTILEIKIIGLSDYH
nr:type II toxin-antitoxin system RelE/ParE family toxin [Listeria booriae]